MLKKDDDTISLFSKDLVRKLKEEGRTPFIFGVSSVSLVNDEREFFEKHKPFGVVLFGKNIPNSGSRDEKVEKFVSLIKDLKSYDLIIFIDQEGGIVQRINLNNIGIKKYHNCLSFGKMYEEISSGEAKKACYENFRELSLELKSFGIDFTFAPIADLYYGDKGAIRNRAFSDKPKVVVDLCKAAIDGIKEGGVGYCIKHAPGHGVARGIDSHFNLPIATEDLDYLLENDFNVFKQLADSNYADFVMTSHVLYEAIDKNSPATKSKDCIDFMRNKLGMQNSIIITDGINMRALHDLQQDKKLSYTEITKSCFDAGCDIVMEVSRNIQIMEKVMDGYCL